MAPGRGPSRSRTQARATPRRMPHTLRRGEGRGRRDATGPGPGRSGIAVRVRRRVAALQVHLVWPVAVRPLGEEVLVQLDAPLRLRVELGHPALDAVRIELGVDRPV